MSGNDYIFFFVQDANFGFSHILVPLNYFKEIKSVELELLNQSYQKCRLKYDNKCVINKLILLKYKKINHHLEIENIDFNIKLIKCCGNILWYANHLHEIEYHYIDKKDETWKDKFIDKFNENINVVDSFIVLDSIDGEYTIPTYLECLKTIDEQKN